MIVFFASMKWYTISEDDWNFSDPRTPHSGPVPLSGSRWTWLRQRGLSLTVSWYPAISSCCKYKIFIIICVNIHAYRYICGYDIRTPISLEIEGKWVSFSFPPLTTSFRLGLRVSTYNSFCWDRGSLIATPPPAKRNKRTHFWWIGWWITLWYVFQAFLCRDSWIVFSNWKMRKTFGKGKRSPLMSRFWPSGISLKCRWEVWKKLPRSKLHQYWCPSTREAIASGHQAS